MLRSSPVADYRGRSVVQRGRRCRPRMSIQMMCRITTGSLRIDLCVTHCRTVNRHTAFAYRRRMLVGNARHIAARSTRRREPVPDRFHRRVVRAAASALAEPELRVPVLPALAAGAAGAGVGAGAGAPEPGRGRCSRGGARTRRVLVQVPGPEARPVAGPTRPALSHLPCRPGCCRCPATPRTSAESPRPAALRPGGVTTPAQI